MQAPSRPVNEEARLDAVYRLGDMDKSTGQVFEPIVRIAQDHFGASFAFFSIVGKDRQYFRACSGFSFTETGRDASFCGHTILGDDVLVVPDTFADRRFHDNPFVTGEPGIRCYAGVPIRSPDGYKVGTLCVVDRRPRTLVPREVDRLRDLAAIVEHTLAGAEVSARLEPPGTDEASVKAPERVPDQDKSALLQNAAALAELGYWIWDHARDRLIYASEETAAILGLSVDEYIVELSDPARMTDWFHPDDRDRYRHVWLGEAKAGRTYELDVRVLRRDGSVRVCREAGAPVLDTAGHLQHTVGILQDVTRERARERELQERFREQSVAAEIASVVLRQADPQLIVEHVLDRAGEVLEADFAAFGCPSADASPPRAVVRSFHGAQPPRMTLDNDRGEVLAVHAGGSTTIRFDPAEHASVLAVPRGTRIIVTSVSGTATPPCFIALYRSDGEFPDHANPFLKAVSNILLAALDRVASEEEHQKALNQLENIANTVPGMIFRRRHCPDGTIEYDYLSARCKDMFGVDPRESADFAERLLGRVHPDDYSRVKRELFEITQATHPGEIEFRAYNQNDEIRSLLTTYTVTALSDGVVRVDGVDLDVTDRCLAEQQAEYNRFHDPITDLPNRTRVELDLAEAITGAEGTSRTVGVAMLDLDGFARINGVHGRAAGDALLGAVGTWLQQEVWKRDTVGRSGGDQFVVVFHALRESADAHRLIGKLFRALNQSFPFGDGNARDTVRPTACIGFALYPNDGRDAASLMDAADSALAHARGQGASSYAFHTPEFAEEARHSLELEGELQDAIERREFRLHYQPQVDARTYEITGAEALVRWEHPERGLLSPGSFIGLAERKGLIPGITRLVIEQACSTLADWRARGQPYPQRMAVNLSGYDLQSETLVSDVLRRLDAADLPYHALELELTESAVVADFERAAGVMQDLAEKGVRLAIDDFGTGYSSLKYLTQLPFHTLKIDRSFTLALERGTANERIVRMIVGLGQGLDQRVVAEGIEYGEHAIALAGMGVDELQGFAFAPPLDIEDAVTLFSRGRLPPCA